MIESILSKLSEVSERYVEIENLLSQPDITSNQENYIKLSKEYSELSPIVKAFKDYEQSESSLDDATFSTLNGQKTVNIKEYEVENKFNNEVKGRILLNEYEDVLINSLGLSVKYDSKFKQSMQSLQLSN